MSNAVSGLCKICPFYGFGVRNYIHTNEYNYHVFTDACIMSS